MTAPVLSKPGLTPIPRTVPWWEAVDRGELLIQRCSACGHRQFYPRILCTACWSEQLEWERASGRGVIRSFTVVHMPGHPAWLSDAPYVIAIVELEEGPRMMTRVVGVDPAAVSVGHVLRVDMRVLSEGEHLLPVFVPSGA